MRSPINPVNVRGADLDTGDIIVLETGVRAVVLKPSRHSGKDPHGRKTDALPFITSQGRWFTSAKQLWSVIRARDEPYMMPSVAHAIEALRSPQNIDAQYQEEPINSGHYGVFYAPAKVPTIVLNGYPTRSISETMQMLQEENNRLRAALSEMGEANDYDN